MLHALRWLGRPLILNDFDEKFVTRLEVPAQPRPVLIFLTRLRDQGAHCNFQLGMLGDVAENRG